jgi:hypothetical protein
MAISNHERVGKALELLRAGLAPFVERELKSAYEDRATAQGARFMGEDRLLASKSISDWDVFRKTLGPAERSLVSELRDHRNKWAP